MFYRRELDGLRALAVVAVIIYHANLKLFGVQLFQGGFFGVDVFFVLSGYLITGIIRNQMEQGAFSFRDFYWRRAKRIVPALLTMLLGTSGLAYLILLPDDLVTYAKSLHSALYFGSNHFFYGEDSYTAAASIYRPLLHTWSLSVEWQFYIVFPLIIWAINRFFPRYMFGILLALASVSLLISSFIVKVNPDMAFYFLLTRAWELILGGLVTFYNRANIESSVKGSFAPITFQALPIIGLFLVVHSMVFIGHEVHHPSFTTLLPVLGTCLFIMFSHKGEISNDVMSLKPIVGLGLISYSLYLWHQPVFVFFRFLKHDHFRFEQFLLLVTISIFLSIITYFFIENFFRKKTSHLANSFLVFIFLLLLLFSIVISLKKGFPNRYGEFAVNAVDINDNNFKIDNVKCQGQYVESACKMIGDGSGNLLLLGDSHAGMLGKHVYNLAVKNNFTYINFSSANCRGIEGLPLSGTAGKVDVCNKNIAEIARILESKEGDKFDIIYSIRQDGIRNDIPEIRNKLELWNNIGHRIILIYSVPLHKSVMVQQEIVKSLRGYSVLKWSDKLKDISIKRKRSFYDKESKAASELFDSIRGDNIYRIYPSEIFCDDNWCYANDDEYIYYYDDDHLSTHGANLVVNEIERKLYLP